METYIGYIKTPQDALIVFEACRRNQLVRVQRRLSSKERIQIRSGSVFAWDEKEAGMRRWTDGRTWSPSRVLGSFLTYRELDTKRRPRRPSNNSSTNSIASSCNNNSNSSSSKKASSTSSSSSSSFCSYKRDGLIKQSFSICTANNQKLHLISYYSKTDILAGRLMQPISDPSMSQITVPKGLYPELNPLDTSGGHSATLHNMQQQIVSPFSPCLSQHSSVDSSITMISPSPLSSPPSLSSSPSTSDDDMILIHDILPSSSSPTPFHHNQHQQKQFSSLSPLATIIHHTPSPSSLLCLLPAQDIAWEKFPSSEDQRQLGALQGLLRL